MIHGTGVFDAEWARHAPIVIKAAGKSQTL
jgi:hypothetical protein